MPLIPLLGQQGRKTAVSSRLDSSKLARPIWQDPTSEKKETILLSRRLCVCGSVHWGQSQWKRISSLTLVAGLSRQCPCPLLTGPITFWQFADYRSQYTSKIFIFKAGCTCLNTCLLTLTMVWYGLKPFRQEHSAHMCAHEEIFLGGLKLPVKAQQV